MHKPIHRTSRSQHRVDLGRFAFEHWQIDNQVYFLTARCRDRFNAFATEHAKSIFWDRFSHWTTSHGFTPWITSLLDNHYHTLGYLRCGDELAPMMRHLHGSVAKRVNDTLFERRPSFFRDSKGREYFDGCIRDERQCRLAFRYVERQAERHGVAQSGVAYPHIRVNVALNLGVKRAHELGAFLEGVAYKRYRREPPAR